MQHQGSNGGAGRQSQIDGEYYGGGGGGGINANAASHNNLASGNTGGDGGVGGGGKGSTQFGSFDGTDGQNGKGGGGGGTDPEYDLAGNGGDGTVIIHHVGVPCFEGLVSECDYVYDGVSTTYTCLTSVTSTSFLSSGCSHVRETGGSSFVSNQASLRLKIESDEGFPDDFSMNDIVIVGGGSISDFTEDNDGTFLFTFTADSDGEKVITSRIVDNAGNTGNASFSFTYDSTVQCSSAEFETITMMTTRNSLEHKNVNCVIARSLTRIKIENDRVHSLLSKAR